MPRRGLRPAATGMSGVQGRDSWLLGSRDSRKPGLSQYFSVLILAAVGSVVGTLGLINLPSGFGFSNFWPAMTLQAVGGIWFGGWGVLAGGLIGLVSNALNHGGALYSLGYLPSNLVQAFLPAWIFRRWRIEPSLPGRREAGVFILGGVILANLAGATLAVGAQALAGGISLSQVPELYAGWLLGNGVPCLLFGIPLLMAFSPTIVESSFFCKNWWGGSPPRSGGWRRFRDWPVAARLLVEFSAAGVVPILILGGVGEVFLSKERGGAGGLLLPMMLNTTIFLSLIISGFAAKRLKRKVGALAEGAHRLGRGDFTYRIEDMGTNELGLLGRAFNDMAGKLTTSREELARTVAEREHARKEMEIAGGIQRSFLPGNPPESPSLEFAAKMAPAKLVGGDFYDFIPLSNNRWGVLVADVAGKGVPAALFMALTRSLVRVYAEDRSSPAGVVGAVNKYVAGDNPTATFVTLCLAYVDPDAGVLTYANAGHNPPLLLRRGVEKPSELAATGTPVGVVEGMEYQEEKVRVGPGDLLVLYTDGVTEAESPAGVMFGRQRLGTLVKSAGEAGASEVLGRIDEALRHHASGAPQSDDITLVVAKWRDAPPREGAPE